MSTFMNLRPGHEIAVKQGYGLVPTSAWTRDTVAFVAKKYAITVTGIVVTEADRDGVTAVGGKPKKKFYISAKARRLQDALALPLEAPYLGREEENVWSRAFREDLL